MRPESQATAFELVVQSFDVGPQRAAPERQPETAEAEVKERARQSLEGLPDHVLNTVNRNDHFMTFFRENEDGSREASLPNA